MPLKRVFMSYPSELRMKFTLRRTQRVVEDVISSPSLPNQPPTSFIHYTIHHFYVETLITWTKNPGHNHRLLNGLLTLWIFLATLIGVGLGHLLHDRQKH